MSYEPKPHQEKGRDLIASCDKKGEFVSVAACVSSGKTLLAIIGIFENIKKYESTFHVFVCPRLNLCKQQAIEIKEYFDKDTTEKVSVLLYNSDNNSDNKSKIQCITDRNVKDDEEFFSAYNNKHIIVVACDESIWGSSGKENDSFIRFNRFQKILKNNEKFNRENCTIVYDEAHNYENQSSLIEELSKYFYASVLMSGTPSYYQKQIHNKPYSKIVDYSIRNALCDDIICRPILNVINGYDSSNEHYLLSAVESILHNEKHEEPFITRLLVNATGIDAINAVYDKLDSSKCHKISLHSEKSVNNNNNKITIKAKVDGEEYDNPKNVMKIIKKLDKSANPFGDNLPIVVFQVDMISEGINIKSFNCALITSHTERKQMQQIGRLLRDIKINGISKKDFDNVNIYAAVNGIDDLVDFICKLEEYELTDSEFTWGNYVDISSSSAPNVSDELPNVKNWSQVTEILSIEKILQMRDLQKNKELTRDFTKKFEELPKKVQEYIKKIFKSIDSSKNKNNKQKNSSNNKKIKNKQVVPTDKKSTQNDKISIGTYLRNFQLALNKATSKKPLQYAWKKDRHDLVYKNIGIIENIDDIDNFVKAIGWRF